MFRVALDFDGTLVENHVEPLTWRPWAREFLAAARDAGLDVVVHTCRATVHDDRQGADEADHFWMTGEVPERVETSWGMQASARAFLDANGFQDIPMWDKPGKPFADYYVDDKASDPDWGRLARELGVDLIAHVNQRR